MAASACELHICRGRAGDGSGRREQVPHAAMLERLGLPEDAGIADKFLQ
jgi:hypothetical protein